MSEDFEKVLDRVKKLLALGKSDSTDEAINAVGLAQRYMTEYSITEAMLKDPLVPEEPIREWEDPIDDTHSTWKDILGAVLAKNNQCVVLKYGTLLQIIGRASDVSKVRYLYSYCVRETERLAANYKGNGRTWLNNFKHGVVDTISDKITTVNAHVRTKMLLEHSSNEKGIVRIDERAAAVETWVKEKYQKLNKGKTAIARHDRSARERGRSDGESISMGDGKGLNAGSAGELE